MSDAKQTCEYPIHSGEFTGSTTSKIRVCPYCGNDSVLLCWPIDCRVFVVECYICRMWTAGPTQEQAEADFLAGKAEPY